MKRAVLLLAGWLLASASAAQVARAPVAPPLVSAVVARLGTPALGPLLRQLPQGFPAELDLAMKTGADLRVFQTRIERALEAARPEGRALLGEQARALARILPQAYERIPGRRERADRFEAALAEVQALSIYDAGYAVRLESAARALRANAARKRTYSKALRIAEVLAPVPGTEAELERALSEVSDRYGMAGLSVVGVSGGEVAASVHLGRANLARGQAVTSDTAFRMASISKSVAAAALMTLYERGKFGLDDDVSGALGFTLRNPNFPNRPITYRHLLTHTSGLRDGKNYFAFLDKTFAGGTVPPLRSLLEKGGADFGDGSQFGPSAPGKTYSYSNLGFGVIGTLVERLSGRPFEEHAREAIFEPLGMEASFTASGLARPERLATIYQRGKDGELKPSTDDFGGEKPASRVPPTYKPGENALIYAPMGGLRVSTTDLSKFLRMLMGGGAFQGARVLAQETVALMLTPLRGSGLGLDLTTALVDGELWAGHEGSAYGLRSGMYLRKDGDVGVVFATNGVGAQVRGKGFLGFEREIFRLVSGFLSRRASA